MNREDKRVWLAGGTAIAVVIAAVAWLVFIGPQLSATKSLRDDAETTRTQNTSLEARVAKLKAQNENVGELQSELRAALDGLPYDTGLPSFTRQVAKQATASGVVLTSITIGTPVAATGPTPTTTGTGGSSTAATSVLSIPVTLVSKGGASDQVDFLDTVRLDGPRRSLVVSTSLVSTADSGRPSIDTGSTMTTQVKVFTSPMTAAAKAQLVKLLAGK